MLHAVIQTESAYDADAISSAGAVGLMQLMPETAKRFGVTDRNDPDQNVEGGTRYLKHLLGLFGPNLHLAVAAYNAGENAVMKYNNSIPPYPETQNYVKQVLALYKRWLASSPHEVHIGIYTNVKGRHSGIPSGVQLDCRNPGHMDDVLITKE